MRRSKTHAALALRRVVSLPSISCLCPSISCLCSHSVEFLSNADRQVTVELCSLRRSRSTFVAWDKPHPRDTNNMNDMYNINDVNVLNFSLVFFVVHPLPSPSPPLSLLPRGLDSAAGLPLPRPRRSSSRCRRWSRLGGRVRTKAGRWRRQQRRRWQQGHGQGQA